MGLRRDARPGYSPSMADGRPVTAAALVALAACASAVAFRHVLDGYFWSDDFVLFYLRRDTTLTEFLLNPFWGHVTLGRNALFAATDWMAGFDPRPYFVTVLAIHVVNVLLLGRVIWRLTDSAVLAGTGALLWGVCPAAGDSLAWYAASAQVAATTCLLLACDLLARHVGRRDTLPTGAAAGAALWLGLSLLFFASALAVAAVWPVVVLLLFPGTRTDRRRLGLALATAAAVLGLFAGVHLAARRLYATPDVGDQVLRGLLAQPRPALIATLQLARVGVTSLVLGAWWTPGPRSDPVSWSILLAALAAWCLGFARGTCGTRRKLAAFALIGLAIYALTAWARAPAARMLSGRTAAQVGATLRYHYAPQAFLAVVLALALRGLTMHARRWIRPALAAGWAAVAVLGVLLGGIPLDLHGPARDAVSVAVAEIETGVLATPPGQTAYIRNRPVPGFGWMPSTMTPLPGLAGLFVIVSPSDELHGRPVRFVEARPEIVALAERRGGRLARLLIPPPPGGGAR